LRSDGSFRALQVGSPNFVRFVYGGAGSAFGVGGPSGSGTIEDVFNGDAPPNKR
jgi:hypothetical protein